MAKFIVEDIILSQTLNEGPMAIKHMVFHSLVVYGTFIAGSYFIV
jgi:hypothetical protein